jgi:hypothetical protein
VKIEDCIACWRGIDEALSSGVCDRGKLVGICEKNASVLFKEAREAALESLVAWDMDCEGSRSKRDEALADVFLAHRYQDAVAAITAAGFEQDARDIFLAIPDERAIREEIEVRKTTNAAMQYFQADVAILLGYAFGSMYFIVSCEDRVTMTSDQWMAIERLPWKVMRDLLWFVHPYGEGDPNVPAKIVDRPCACDVSKALQLGAYRKVDFDFTLDCEFDVGKAASKLRSRGVSPHEDGWYHCEARGLDDLIISKIFKDPAWQKVNTPLSKQGWLNPALGVMFFFLDRPVSAPKEKGLFVSGMEETEKVIFTGFPARVPVIMCAECKVVWRPSVSVEEGAFSGREEKDLRSKLHLE